MTGPPSALRRPPASQASCELVISRALNAARRVRAALRGAPPAATPDPGQLVDRRVAEIVAGLIDRASAARDVKDYRGAALLFAEALRLQPDHFGVAVQCGHMFKEAGDLVTAETYYLTASKLQPDDPDLALQLGHFYKVAGRMDKAEAAYRRALELIPGWADPAGELVALRGTTRPPEQAQDADIDLDRLAPELFPRPAHELQRTCVDSVQIRQLGARQERTRWGAMRTLRGVEAIRGVCISAEPIAAMSIHLDERVIHQGPIEGFAFPGARDGQLKYVFNVWRDFTGWPEGPCRVAVRFTTLGGDVRTHVEYVVVAPAWTEAELPECDGVVDMPGVAPEALEAAINARPSMVRQAERNLFPDGVKSVLVLRTDQLGDMATSTPAVRRLRELLPGAKLVGLLTSGNAEFAATLGLFDEIIVIDFPDDPLERRRLMGPQAQEQLRRRLHAYDFDIALDLAESGVSRPVLLLSGAKFLYGYYAHHWPFMDGGFDGTTRDRRNGHECMPQSTKVRALVERLGSTLKSHAEVIPRPELRRDQLEPYGIGPDISYAVLHTGARIRFSRWPGYGALAALLLERTDLDVVIMAEETDYADRLPPEVRASPRVHLLTQRLPFDDFDAFLSFCSVFVGNDTGPKHLAAIRGAPTISIHSARINWGEWGQELTGSIISRRVPCAGCMLYHDADECGKAFACVTKITPAEVFEAVSRWL